MELGALVCTARTPDCEHCPVADLCSWRALGYPEHDGPPRRGQAWHGTDRQCRGVLLDLVRQTPDGVQVDVALTAWADEEQARRCLDGLLADELVRRMGSLLRL